MATLRSFTPDSQAAFIEIFESQITDQPKHIPLARNYGLSNIQIFKLNANIIGLLVQRSFGNKPEAQQKLSSLLEAQLTYLNDIGRSDLVEQYNNWRTTSEEARAKVV